MGRLDDIIARNKRPNRNRERMVVMLGLGLFLLLILGLMVFTDLGARPPDHPPPPPDHSRVDDVQLRAPRPRIDAGVGAAPDSSPR